MKTLWISSRYRKSLNTTVEWESKTEREREKGSRRASLIGQGRGKYLALGDRRRCASLQPPKGNFQQHVRASLDGSFLKILGSHPNTNLSIRFFFSKKKKKKKLLFSLPRERERESQLDGGLEKKKKQASVAVRWLLTYFLREKTPWTPSLDPFYYVMVFFSSFFFFSPRKTSKNGNKEPSVEICSGNTPSSPAV